MASAVASNGDALDPALPRRMGEFSYEGPDGEIS